MTIATRDDGKPIIDKRQQIKELRDFHQATLDHIGASTNLFVPKMAYKPIGKNEVHIGFFASEINKGEDVYVEFCSRENIPEDPERQLYKFKNNPHFAEEYTTTDPSASTGNVRYLVPIEELIKIPKFVPVTSQEQTKLEFEIDDPETDLPISQLTIRDLAAILLQHPCSRKTWLNELVSKK
jgi:hypothetical protein